MHKHNFSQTLKLHEQSAVVTVNIRSRSLKSKSLSKQITCTCIYLCKFGAEKNLWLRRQSSEKAEFTVFLRMMILNEVTLKDTSRSPTSYLTMIQYIKFS